MPIIDELTTSLRKFFLGRRTAPASEPIAAFTASTPDAVMIKFTITYNAPARRLDGSLMRTAVITADEPLSAGELQRILERLRRSSFVSEAHRRDSAIYVDFTGQEDSATSLDGESGLVFGAFRDEVALMRGNRDTVAGLSVRHFRLIDGHTAHSWAEEQNDPAQVGGLITLRYDHGADTETIKVVAASQLCSGETFDEIALSARDTSLLEGHVLSLRFNRDAELSVMFVVGRPIQAG